MFVLSLGFGKRVARCGMQRLKLGAHFSELREAI